MKNIISQPTRREFVRYCGAGASMLAAGMVPASAFAAAAGVLPGRVDATPLWLNYNENSLGMSQQAVAAAQRATRDSGNRYPDASVAKLRAMLAGLHEVDTAQVIFGNGSTEVIQAVVTYAEGLSASLLEPVPTFGDARRYSEAEKLQIIQVPVAAGFETDLTSMKKQADATPGAVLINICNPNNPTGTIVDSGALTSWINNAPDNHIFLIDEAYFEYAESNPAYSSVLPLIRSGKENLIVTRTFSKIYGMAGMRIGYGIAAPKTAAEVRKFAAGYNLSAGGTAAALASLADTEFYKTSLNSNQAAKNILLAALDELQLAHIESNTNFVLHRIGGSVTDYARRMADNGIHVGRRMTREDGWNRISVGTPQEMQLFVQVLKEFRARSWV